MEPEFQTVTRPLLFLMLCLVQWAMLLLSSHALASTEHLVYFSNTPYELNIYKIHGTISGKTLMLIGGIQGNEPGGFLSADLYADMSLKKGNLIVVPRANFYSIILNHRGPHGDMNRKFSAEDNTASMEDRIVTELKKLISESDFLLNLHDGAGYYYPEYIDKWRNPLRFGQSVIADTDEYCIPGKKTVIKLKEIGEQILSQVNPHIPNELYQFHFMNTRTGAVDSIHEEQKKSATYYALTVHHIPSFGVETSKFLPTVELKVMYHNLIINAFMEYFGIIAESPGRTLDTPVLKYLIVSIDGEPPIVAEPNHDLELYKGVSINVSHVEANYERGLSVDILEHGSLNDFRKNIVISKDTSIIIRKDNHIFGEIAVNLTGAGPLKPGAKAFATVPEKVEYFVVEAKGHKILLEDGEILELTKGERMKILEIFPKGMPGITVNFKGFVGDKINNTGEDRGYEIDTGEDLLKRYSLNKNGEYYQVLVSLEDDTVLARLIIRLLPQEIKQPG
jgi:hypothetical protein